MKNNTIPCPSCQTTLSAVGDKLGQQHLTCNHCKKKITLVIFPAFSNNNNNASETGKQLFNEGDASCFYHKDKQAEVACDHCGRFLCSLCDLEISSRHICPNCLKSADSNTAMQNNQERTRYDIALFTFAFFPMLMFWPVLITAPLVFIGSFIYWKKPRSIIGHNGLYRLFALLLSIIQIILIALAIFLFIHI